MLRRSCIKKSTRFECFSFGHSQLNLFVLRLILKFNFRNKNFVPLIVYIIIFGVFIYVNGFSTGTYFVLYLLILTSSRRIVSPSLTLSQQIGIFFYIVSCFVCFLFKSSRLFGVSLHFFFLVFYESEPLAGSSQSIESDVCFFSLVLQRSYK